MKRLTGMVMCLLASTMHAYSQGPDALPKLTGKYRCQPDPRDCLLGQTFSVTQSGDRVEISSDKGEALFARLATDRSLTMGAPWNVLGVIYGSDIQWSNGTRWGKTD
jgi:hypothetical protein